MGPAFWFSGFGSAWSAEWLVVAGGVHGQLRSRAAGLLSGGEQQMVAFGRAVLADAHLLLLDEPSMGLAPIMVDVVTDAVATLSDLNLSILMVEQNAEAAFSVADRAYVLEQGEVVLAGPAEEVAANPRVMASFLGVEQSRPAVSSPDGDEQLVPD